MDFSKLTKNSVLDKDLYISNVIIPLICNSDEQCGICYEEFTSTSLPKFLSCHCKLAFHKDCLIDMFAKMTRSCPQCRNTGITIVDFKAGIIDFDKYESIYDKFKNELDKEEWLIFLCNWTIPIKTFESVQRPITLNSFDYTDYTKFSIGWNQSKIFDMKGKRLSILSKGRFQTGMKTCCDIDEFKNEFNKYTLGIFNDINWDGICIAGGLISKLLNKSVRKDEINSDVDIFVYGSNQGIRDRHLIKVLKFFKDIFGDNIYFVPTYSVINLIIIDYPRQIQIIYTKVVSIADVLASFDVDHVRCAYSGGNETIVLPKFLESFRYQVTELDNEAKYRIRRMLKIAESGFSLLSKTNVEGIVDAFINITEKPYFPKKEDTDIVDKIAKNYKVKNTEVFTDWGKCLSKIDQGVNIGTSPRVYMEKDVRFNILQFEKLSDLTVIMNPLKQFIKFSYAGTENLTFEIQNVSYGQFAGYCGRNSLVTSDIYKKYPILLEKYHQILKTVADSGIKEKIDINSGAIIVSKRAFKIYHNNSPINYLEFSKILKTKNTVDCIKMSLLPKIVNVNKYGTPKFIIGAQVAEIWF